MHVILDATQDAAHGDFLRTVPGAYEWWYFDAVSDDGAWSLACIWFLGNPFSPYYPLAARQLAPDPYAHNALFFALYHNSTLYDYHYRRFPACEITADEQKPACLQFGPNSLIFNGYDYSLTLQDQNANGRIVNALLRFETSLALPSTLGFELPLSVGPEGGHWWLPVAPECRATVQIDLLGEHNTEAERIVFTGRGYHDHNWGTLPFAKEIRDWYWARMSFGPGSAIILYHVIERNGTAQTHLLMFKDGTCVQYDHDVQVQLSRWRLNGFGTQFATVLKVTVADLTICFRFRERLDSAPFYLRLRGDADMQRNGESQHGTGIGEYFRPRIMSWPIVASAMKARIVDL